ncbi:hypothetical protein [Corynebacterium mustelae]|uniref:hypothetical protein n=1 Tax=Corynebacterium mustelae TaxID=571915 RepID=UPI001187323A|nr:hypothetical protein [Corynebacterium mustelae]
MILSQTLITRPANHRSVSRFFLWCCLLVALVSVLMAAPPTATVALVAIGAVLPCSSVSVVDAGGRLTSSPLGSQLRSSLLLSKGSVVGVGDIRIG